MKLSSLALFLNRRTILVLVANRKENDKLCLFLALIFECHFGGTQILKIEYRYVEAFKSCKNHLQISCSYGGHAIFIGDVLL